MAIEESLQQIVYELGVLNTTLNKISSGELATKTEDKTPASEAKKKRKYTKTKKTVKKKQSEDDQPEEERENENWLNQEEKSVSSGLNDEDDLLGSGGMTVTKDMIRSKAHEIISIQGEERGKTNVVGVFKKFGVRRISELSESKYSACYEALQGLI